MCRLFAQVAPTAAKACDLLVDSPFSLLKQSNFDRGNLQKDGWGIAHFGNHGKPSVSKSAGAPYEESARFEKAAHGAVSRLVIGHIRAASNPKGLPPRRLLSRANAQPFTDGTWVFAHNGTLEIPDEVAARLGPLRRGLKSDNDSEVYFWQFIKFLRRTKDPVEALRRCVREDWELWNTARLRHPEKKVPYTSLNVVAGNGKRLIAFCHFTPRPEATWGVCNPTQPWPVMCFSRREGRLIVASENLDRGPWTRLRPTEALVAELTARGTLALRRRRLSPRALGVP